MSATLNFNEKRNIAWKGQTFNQIVAGLKMNTRTFSTTSTQGFFLAPPQKHYRREIASTTDVCSTKGVNYGEAFFQPGGSIVNTTGYGAYSVDFSQSTDKSNNPTGKCDTVACSKQADARRLVRSSGGVRKKYNASNDTYYTSTTQYLNSRNRTVKQNEYSYVRTGDPSYKPGSPNSIANVYRASGINHCAKFHFTSNPLFQYQWLDGVVYNFSMAPGFYDLGELMSAFYSTLTSRLQYYNDSVSGGKVFLYNIVYDTLSDKVQIQCFATNTTIHPSTRYSIPVGAPAPIPDYTIVPQIRILANEMVSALGIPSANYPYADISGNTSGQRNQTQPAIRNPGGESSQYNVYGSSGATYYSTTPNTTSPGVAGGNQFYTGTVKPGIATPYVPLYYKPSNSKFANQGGVDSSARLNRLKYDTVTNSANTFMTAYGKATADAYAYGVPSPGYTLKDKVGYGPSLAPTFKNNSVQSCPVNHIRGG
jgi:hypothetical protein